MDRSEESGGRDGGRWRLEAIQAAEQLISDASTPAEIGTRLPETLVESTEIQVAWIGQPHPAGGTRIRASSQPMPEHLDVGEASRTRLAIDTETVQTGSPDPEYQQLREESGIPAVENTVSLPLATDSGIILHLYTDAELKADSAESFETLGGVITTGLQRARLSTELDRERCRLDEIRTLVCHDFGNPLNLAAGRLDLVRTECESEHISHVETGLQQIEQLADEATTFITVGWAVDERESLSLEEIGQNCWRLGSKQRGTLDITDTTVIADSKRLRRILNELFENVFAHTEGTVTVEVGPLENDAGFYVADDGPGIPNKECEYVFDRGYTTDTDREGNGLAIVDELVAAHDWEVTLADGPGTRIEIRTDRW